jgi:D-3-phosphoglycerate dehydrogenase
LFLFRTPTLFVSNGEQQMSGNILRLNAVTSPIGPFERQALATIDAQVVEVENPEDCDRLAEIDAVMIISAYLRAETIAKLTRCHVVSRMGTGCDKIDIDELTRRGIILANVPDALTEEVADHTMALLLSVHRRLKVYEKSMRKGVRLALGDMRRLSTQTVGIVGFGRIGRAFAVRAKVFGVRVLVMDPVAAPDEVEALGFESADFGTILRESDYLCLLCPLTPATRGMLGMPQFRLMKPTAVLINTGRGELVNERELAQALNDGVIAYAGIDTYGDFNVFAEGGFPTDHPLFQVENVQMTPHVAAISREAMEEVVATACGAVEDVLGGRLPKFVVNPAVEGNARFGRR